MKGHDIAIMVGPPGKSKGKPAGDGDEYGGESESDEGGDEEAEESAMEEFQGALKSGTPAEALEAYKKLRDICG